MMATSVPFTSRITYGLNTGSPKSAVFTFCATNSIRPASSATACLTRSAP
jgi:hypothetical protein